MSLHSPSMFEVAKPHGTKSDKIRALARAGYPRAEIARFMGIKYQFVRNVLEGDKLRPQPSQPQALSSSQRQADRMSKLVGHERIRHLNIEPGGKVRLPDDVIQALGWREGGVIVAELDGERFTLLSPQEALRRAREGIAPWKEGEPLWSDELIAERRRENKAEESDD